MYKKYTSKWIMRIKFTTLILFFSLVQVSAMSHAQKITFQQKDATLKQFFDEINKQTGYGVLWSPNLLKSDQTLDIDLREVALQDALAICLQHLPLQFHLEDKTIIIKETTPLVINRWNETVQERIDVRGRVVNETGEALTGATVLVKGTGRSVITGSQGAFYLPGINQDVVLVFSYLGYERKEVK